MKNTRRCRHVCAVVPEKIISPPATLIQDARRSKSRTRSTKELKQKPFLSAAKIVVKPGRFLVAEVGLYVARVVEVKRSRGKWFVIVDGGMHHHLAASGNLGQTIKQNYPVALLGKLDCQSEGTFDVVSPLCTPLDVLVRNVPLPQPEPGDLFGIFQSGAYARTASPLDFLGHAAPPEVWVEAGSTHLIRVRGNFDDPLRDQRRLQPLVTDG